ncbi:MAG: long-chain fatty acid--CoA ligase [Betaproteobacteria bacterium]|nr:long-chain fatty acid--CoA ligase [Betaproteobacteria bacterium]
MSARQPPHYRFWPKNLPHDISRPRTSLSYNLDVSAARYPDKTALLFYDTHISYAELRDTVDQLAGYLQQNCGIKRGDRVAVYMQNSPQFIMAYYAILRADAMVVPINAMLTAEEVRHLVTDSGARAIFAAQDLLPRLAELQGEGTLSHVIVATYADYLRAPTDLAVPDFVSAARISAPGTVTWEDALGTGRTPASAQAGPDDLCVMPYTSGTTGLPKGCIHTHATVMHTLMVQTQWYGGLCADQVALCTLPLFHVTAMQSSMNTPIYGGLTIVVLPRWDRDVAGMLIARYKVNNWSNITTMLVDFLANPKLVDYDISSLSRVSGGGASMPDAVAKKFKELTGLDYLEGYGLSETIAPSHINPPEHPKRQCLGIPICNTDSRIVHPDTLEELPPGEVGEIITSGPGVFKGYWNDEAKTRESFIELDGKTFFRTGDLARIDEDGYFFMVDRLKRMINASGFKVWPAEIEAMLYAHPDIQEACVIASSDAHRGETVKAYVVLRAHARGKARAEDIVAWSREHMAAYKYPRIVEFVDALPKSGTGKVQWRLLQEKENARTAKAA